MSSKNGGFLTFIGVYGLMKGNYVLLTVKYAQ